MAAVPTLPTIGTGPLPTSQLVQLRDALAFAMAPPTAKLRQATLQSIPNNTFTAVNFDAEDRDSVNGHDNATNNSRYTAVYPGWYQISGGFCFASSATGRRLGEVAINGAVASNGSIGGGPGAATIIGYAVRTDLYYLAVGDYVELKIFQDSGGAINTFVTNAEYQCSLVLKWVSN